MIKIFIGLIVIGIFSSLYLGVLEAHILTFEELSICFHSHTEEIQTKMLPCSEEDYQCMVDVVVEVCS